MLNDKRIKACISRYDNGTYSRIQFLAAVSHSISWVLTHRGTVSNCRQQQQRRGWNVWGVTIDNVRVVRIASDSCSSAYVCTKRKIQKNSEQQSPIVARCLLRWTVTMLCCMNQWSISLQSSSVWRSITLPPFAVCASVRDKSQHCENGER